MTTNSQIHSMNSNLQVREYKGQPVDRPCPDKNPRKVAILYPLAQKVGEAALELGLQKRSLLRLTGDHSGEKMIVVSGVIWITQSGAPEDIFLHAGESFDITQKGAILVEGMVGACLKITRSQSLFDFGRVLGNAFHHVISGSSDRVA